jgi:hypothetical protein
MGTLDMAKITHCRSDDAALQAYVAVNVAPLWGKLRVRKDGLQTAVFFKGLSFSYYS